MANSQTEHSKRLRAESSKKARQKRRADPNYRAIALEGDAEVINRFIALLEATQQPTRIKQLSVLLEQFKSQ